MRVTIRDIQRMTNRGEHPVMVTAYDYTSAQLVDRAGIPMILVGDTLGMVVLGYDTTIPVTLDDIIHHARAVTRGSTNALVIADLPFMTYTTPDVAEQSVKRIMQEAGVQAVKLEGGAEIVPTVRRLVELGVPVMGHIGLTPQSVNQLSGMRVQGRRAEDARRLIADALALEEAGVFAVVLELVPMELAAEIARRLHVTTVGIGAGPGTDGQVQVWHDLLGLYSDFVPRHARQYARLGDTIVDALTRYRDDVHAGSFPTTEHASSMKPEDLDAAIRLLDGEG
ncbi:MAG TPA: 3-methyl-2-oxobutanoate hydroxymethyltransferase [Chloroflexota bacterium]|nr:3-methyl-2-oxobutanoate hydroxymethyltransferase [Chloroflexota bacterium]